MTFAHPLPGATVTTRYGAPSASPPFEPHSGIDFAYGGGSCGRRVLAAAAGTARARENLGGGHGIVIDHGGGVETGYWHLGSRLILDGQGVSQGQAIGLVGASGTRVTGCHLHFEVKIGGRTVDPAPYLAGAVHAAPSGGPDSFPRDPGASCPAGYVPGTVNPQAHAWLPGSPWWNRPRNPDGTVDACVRAGLAPGDNTALTDAGEGLTVALGSALPLLANGAIIIVALVIGWAGVRQALGIR